MKHYYAKSQTLEFGAVFVWGLCLRAINRTWAWTWNREGWHSASFLALGFWVT